MRYLSSTERSTSIQASAVIFLSLIKFCLAAKPCFFPNGGVAEEFIPCSDSDDVTFCCAPGNACLSNKICINVENVSGPKSVLGLPTRGACTDRGWNSDKCPKFCYQDTFNNNQAGLTLACGNNMYCCQEEGNSSACCDQGLFPGAPSANFIKEIPLVQGSNSNTNSSSDPLASFTDINGPTPSAETLQTTTPSIQLPVSTATFLPPTPLPQQTSASKSWATKNSALGLGLGLGLGIPLLVALGFVMYYAFRIRQQRKQSMHKAYYFENNIKKRKPIEMSGSYSWQPPTEMDVPAPRYSVEKPEGFPERWVGGSRETEGERNGNLTVPRRMASYHGGGGK